MIYRLLAMNIDGTILNSRGKVPKATKNAIDFVKDKGIYVTLVTSRNFQSAKKVADALNLNSTLVTHSGAFVSSSEEYPNFEKRFTQRQTEELVVFLENYHCNIRISHEKFSLGNRKRLQSNLVAKAVLSNIDPLFYPIQFVDSLSQTLQNQPVATPKIDLFFAESQEKTSAVLALRRMFPTINIIDGEDGKVEIVPAGVSKASGLKKLGDMLGITLQEMVVIGDSITDIDMIKQVGLGVAMWNAPVEVKFAADWVTRSNNQNGVSYMIIEHFRKQFPIPFLQKYKVLK